MNPFASKLRPRDLASLLLAAGTTMPRRRARDQQADRAGLNLKRRVLEELIARDPGPDELESCLSGIVASFGAPFGPTRSIARIILEEWNTAQAAPQWIAHLQHTGDQPQDSGGTRLGRQLPG